MLRFGRGAIDISARLLEWDGESQHLEPQAFDLLAYLVEHSDRVVPKTELLDEVWGDQFVSESALTTRVKEIRRVLADDGTRQRVIKNFRGRGYRFVVEIDDRGQISNLTRDQTAATYAAHATSLLGRDADIDETLRLLETAKVVTLVGPGGVGKTSVARDIARRQRDRHEDGALVVRLSAVRDPDSVVHVFRRDTGLAEAGPSESDLIEAIAALDALIVVDNCEHVIDEVSRFVTAIGAIDGPARFLMTSRERLGLANEQVWPLAPLDPASARRLLLERAQAAQPGYNWPTEAEASVLELISLLDRLPLAIEMAAARLPTIGIEDLIDALTERLDLLRSTDRSADDRHRTISHLIEWSENLLDEPARDLLTALSAFAGPVSAADLAAVAEADKAELSVGPLATLVDHSLVVVNTIQQPTTYRLLETVRARAALRRSPQMEARHANYVINTVTDLDRMLRTPDEADAAKRLDQLNAEIRLAHRWARQQDPARAGELTAALIHYALERQWAEPATWATSLADLVDPSHPAALAAAAVRAADCSNRGEYEAARELAERAVASTDVRVLASALDTLANIGMYTGDLASAQQHGATLRDLGKQHADGMIRTSGLMGELLALTYGGQATEAERLLENEPAPPSPTASAWILYGHGEVAAALGHERDAIDYFEQAIEQGLNVDNRFVVSVSQVSSLAARTRAGDLHEAREAFLPVLTHYRRIRNLTHGITALRNLIELLVRAGEDQTAMTLLGALSNPTVKATYGIESERLEQARATVIERNEPLVVEVWIEEGSINQPIEALDYAITALTPE